MKKQGAAQWCTHAPVYDGKDFNSWKKACLIMLRLYVYKIYMYFLLLATTVPHLVIHKILCVQHLRQTDLWSCDQKVTILLSRFNLCTKFNKLSSKDIERTTHMGRGPAELWWPWIQVLKSITVVYLVTIKQKGIKVLSGQFLRWRPCSSLVLIVNHMTCKNN